MSEKYQILFKLGGSHLLFPAAIIILSFFLRNDDYLLVSVTQTMLIIVLLAGYWEFFGIFLKRLFFVLSEILILFSFGFRVFFENTETPNPVFMALLFLIQLVLLFVLIKMMIVIYKREKVSFEIGFPFKNGNYLITDGGNSKISRLMNYHFHSQVHKKKNTNYSMLFATDIVKIHGKKPNFLPLKNEEYPVFGEAVFCPMNGTVVKTENTIDDNLPFSGNYPYNTGNTVVIKNNNYYFLLGHLKKDSVTVSVGDSVKQGDFIGRTGNSGMSERPHIHMQLMKSETGDYWHGTGISIQYKNKNLYKNRMIIV